MSTPEYTPDMPHRKRLRHLDLFSGIGGFALAVRWLGHETVGFVEWDEWCQRVLKKNFPGVPVLGDITEVSGDEFGPVDLVTGGYPCQPFSVAGQRRGAEDDRHLWPHMRRVIDTARPRFVLAENVAGHISMGLDTVLAEMEADGYTAGAVVVPAGAVNALHRRDRIWILAHADDGQRDGADGPVRAGRDAADGSGELGGLAGPDPDTHGERELQPQGAVAHERGRTSDLRGAEPVAHANGAGREEYGRSQPVQSQHATAEHGGCVRAGTEATRALDPRPDGLPPGLVRSRWRDGSWEHGLPRVVTEEKERRQKLQAAGNAIVPVVAYEILRVMLGDNS